MIVKRGNRYGVRIYRDGHRHWIGTFTKMGEARAAERQALARQADSPLTCDRFARDWLEQGCPTGHTGRTKKPSTLSGYRGALGQFAHDFHGVPLNGISRDVAHRWATDHRSALQFVRAMFNQARNRALVDHNPFEKLGLPRGEGRRDRSPLSETELHDLAQAARDLYDPEGYGHVPAALIITAGYTGLRQGELFALQWDDVDIEQQTIHVQRSVWNGQTVPPKSGRARVVLLPPPAREALQDMARLNAIYLGWDQTGFVFRQRQGGPFTKSTFLHPGHKDRQAGPPIPGVWRAIREHAGRPDLAFHELRHMAGHFFYVTLDMSDADVAYQLGHRDGGRLVRTLYGHGDHGALDRLKRAFDRPIPIEGGSQLGRKGKADSA